MKKVANAIVVGGTIAAGKSSLVGALPFNAIHELDPNDELQNVLIKKMYEGDMIAKQVFQLDMLLSRFDKYKKIANNEKTHVFDRMIFEDKIFAFKLFGDNKNIWEYYNSIWHDKVDEIISEIGIPKLYILLDVNWDNFVKRLFARNRKSEIVNFSVNESYFKEIVESYIPYMSKMFDELKIPYVIVDTNEMNKIEVIEHVEKILADKGII